MSAVEASFEFLQWQPSFETQKPYEVLLPLASLGENKNSIPRSNLVFESRSVHVQDVRGHQDDFSLDTHGFQFVRQTSIVRNLKDRAAVSERYIPEMEELLRQHLQKAEGKEVRTFCFDLRVCCHSCLYHLVKAC